MIWNDKILFLHTPKTAGMSLMEVLLKKLPGEVVVTGPYGQKQKREGNIKYLQGKRHETMCDAESTLIYFNKSIADFDAIFSVMRNPYDLELSRYSYLRKKNTPDRGLARDIALAQDFKGYLSSAPFFGMYPPRLHFYFSINNLIPENLVVLKYENLVNDIDNYLSPYLTDFTGLPRVNVSKHRDYREEYDAEMEELCFNRHRWFFEKGFYSRERFDTPQQSTSGWSPFTKN